MRIQDIYTKYKVPPHLQQHMYRVAWIAKNISQNRNWKKINHKAIFETALLHDLGNILKFNMSLYPDFWEPEWVTYRTQVKESFKKYWTTEHEATLNIAQEIWTNKESFSLLKWLITYPSKIIDPQEKREIRVADYCDARVWPHWVMTLEKRVEDLIERNMKNKGLQRNEAERISKERYQSCKDTEKIIMENSLISPKKIFQKEVDNVLQEMKEYALWTTS